MNPQDIKCFLLWSLVINYGILFIWFGTFAFAHDWVYRMHTRWFRMSVETFDAINYGGVAIYKIGIALLNLVPLIALAILY
jgi:hypothetical protein